MSAQPQAATTPPGFPATARPAGWWGMVLFILTEGMLFSLLITSYFYLRSVSVSWPPGDIEMPALLLPSIGTIILLGSSLPMFYATHAIARNNRRGLIAGMGVSFVLGAVFLVLQAYELSELGFSHSTNAYGSVFITLTGFHAAHLVVGMLMLAFIIVRSFLGHFTDENKLAPENVALYWHFVDAIWIAVFLTLHISPHLLSSSPQ